MLKRSLMMLAAGILIPATAYGGMADGYCYLSGRTNHCLSVVELDDSALHLPQETDATGYYGPFVLVAPGWHTFSYEHVGYEPAELDYFIPALGATLPPITLETKAMCNPATWQHYPYTIPSTAITFPYDEGKHDPTSTYRIEWWYVNLHLTDETGEEYAGIVSFFKPPVVGSPGMVLFSLIDLESGIRYADAKYPLVFDAEDQYLHLSAGVPPQDTWRNRSCEADLVPFESHMSVSWADDGVNWLELDMASLKPPMPVGGDGYVEFGSVGWSWYYSHPRVDILGKMHLQGFPALGREVEGYGWIDHQWASFPVGDVGWEWFSLQLDNLTDIMAADVWIEGNQQPFSGGLNYYDGDCSHDVLYDYNITRTRCWYDTEHDETYATQWRIEEPSRQIDLLVSAVYEHQVMETTGEIIGANFWEGACTVTGTIEGQPVEGTAFAELTHGWDGLPQACCADGGECWYVPHDLCIAQGGTPQGAGTDCDTLDCPRACCLPSGDCQTCTPSVCYTQGGTPQEIGEVCEPSQACCLPGSACEMLAPVCCMAEGGTPMGVGSDCDPNPCRCGCCPEGEFGSSENDRTISSGVTLNLTGDKDYHNLTIESGGALNTNGHTLRVCGTLLNKGTIFARNGVGGEGGQGGKGGNPEQTSVPSGCGPRGEYCTPGQPGDPGTGRGGHGGGGGGGGGGAKNLGRDADGGNGADGGQGGYGGGDVLIYAFRLDNQGTIHADGGDGEDAADAPSGYDNCGAEDYEWPLHDLEGGGGGGGAGGDGGDGGIVQVFYGTLVQQGSIHADGGQGGQGGAGGESGGCDERIDTLGEYQNGCSGAGGGGHGGRGAYAPGDCAVAGGPGDDGDDGEDGSWDVIPVVFDDCNGNGCPDECDIYIGVSRDCQPNDVPDECDLEGCPAGEPDCDDCNGNDVPDWCDIDDCPPWDPDCGDCNANRRPDSCDIADCPLGEPGCDDCNTNSIPDSCDIGSCPSGDPSCDDCNGNGRPDACDIHDCSRADSTCHDCNHNGTPDGCEPEFVDVNLFITQLLADSPNPDWVCMFDQNGDGILNGLDIPGFLNRVLSQP